jgi:hypothetical protein
MLGPPFSPSLAFGVDQRPSASITATVCPSVSPKPLLPYFSWYRCRRSRRRGTSDVPNCPASGVGQVSDGEQEEALSAVACSGLGRAEYSDRNATAQSFQCRDCDFELTVEVPRDVLAEEGMSPALIKDLDGAVEQPSIVVGAEALSGDAVSLAGISRQDAIHCAAPCWSVEGSQVRPDSSRMKPPRFHARDQACGC